MKARGIYALFAFVVAGQGIVLFILQTMDSSFLYEWSNDAMSIEPWESQKMMKDFNT
jgi:hypothetical protein